MIIRVVIDRDRCMGSGNCVFRAPAVFDVDEENTSVVVGDPSGDEERVRLAVDDCPTAALSIVNGSKLGDGSDGSPDA